MLERWERKVTPTPRLHHQFFTEYAGVANYPIPPGTFCALLYITYAMRADHHGRRAAEPPDRDFGNFDRSVDFGAGPGDAALLNRDTNPLSRVRQRTEWWLPGTDNCRDPWTLLDPAILEESSASRPTPP